MREIEEDDSDPREYLASAVCAVANCSPITLRAWRNRNGLFPKTKMAGGWNRFSLADIAATKLVAHLTTTGFAAQTAVDIAMKLLPVLEREFIAVSGEHEYDLSNQHLVVSVDAKGRITFARQADQADLAALFTQQGDPIALLIINLLNLMDMTDRLELVSPDEKDLLKSIRKATVRATARRQSRSKPKKRNKPK